MSNITATPAKLRNGSWGARIQGSASVGDTITIRTQAGKTWEAKVTSIVWTGEGVTLVATASMDRAPAARSGGTRYTQRCYHGHTSPKAGCRDCFDTFDY